MRIPPIKQDDESPDRDGAVSYIGSMARELASLARRHGYPELSFILEIAATEADTIGGVPEGEQVL